MAIEKQKLIEALEEYQKYNQIRNDLDAYLYSIGQWALWPEDITKPNKADYGLD